MRKPEYGSKAASYIPSPTVTRFVDLNGPRIATSPKKPVQQDIIPQQRQKSKVVMVTRVDSEDESSVDKSSSSFRSIIPSSQEDNLYMRKGIVLPVLDFSTPQ